VGFHVLGPNAGEMTQGWTIGLKLNATKGDFDNSIGIHPTCAEVSLSLTFYVSVSLSLCVSRLVAHGPECSIIEDNQTILGRYYWCCIVNKCICRVYSRFDFF